MRWNPPLSSLVFSLAMLLFSYSCSSAQEVKTTPSVQDTLAVADTSIAQDTVPFIDTLQRISMVFVGDLMCHSTQFNYRK